MIIVEFDCETVSEANQSRHAHWSGKAKRVRLQRDATTVSLMTRGIGLNLLPKHGALLVILTRIGARLLDTDNLAGSLKAVRDATARWLGCDDNPSAPVTWAYDQQKRKGPLSRVRIQIQPRQPVEVRP
jgi:hypothetical protein